MKPLHLFILLFCIAATTTSCTNTQVDKERERQRDQRRKPAPVAEVLDTITTSFHFGNFEPKVYSEVPLDAVVWVKVYDCRPSSDSTLFAEGRVEKRVQTGSWNTYFENQKIYKTRNYKLVADVMYGDTSYALDIDTGIYYDTIVVAYGHSVFHGKVITNRIDGTRQMVTEYRMGEEVGWSNHYDALGRLTFKHKEAIDGTVYARGFDYVDSLHLRYEGPQRQGDKRIKDTTYTENLDTGEMVAVIQEYSPYLPDSIWNVYSTKTKPHTLLYQLRYELGECVDTIPLGQ